MFQNIVNRLKQPSTIIGIVSAVVTLATTGISAAPSVLSALLVSLGLVAVNA